MSLENIIYFFQLIYSKICYLLLLLLSKCQKPKKDTFEIFQERINELINETNLLVQRKKLNKEHPKILIQFLVYKSILIRTQLSNEVDDLIKKDVTEKLLDRNIDIIEEGLIEMKNELTKKKYYLDSSGKDLLKSIQIITKSISKTIDSNSTRFTEMFVQKYVAGQKILDDTEEHPDNSASMFI